jgi:rfaE bifunctional protein kinase chain/domain
MNDNLSRLIGSFPGLHVLVLGEAMLDCYLEGKSGRLCQEAPVPVVSITDRREVPGGAANTAVNARGLGARVSFLSVTGDDAEGAALRLALEARGVATDDLLSQPSRRTLAKHRVVSAAQLLVRYDQGDTGPVAPAVEQALLGRLERLFPECDALIISDYGYGVVTPRVIAALARLQARAPRVLVADSKRLAAYRRVGLTAVKPNYNEALQLLCFPELPAARSRSDAMAAQRSTPRAPWSSSGAARPTARTPTPARRRTPPAPVTPTWRPSRSPWPPGPTPPPPPSWPRPRRRSSSARRGPPSAPPASCTRRSPPGARSRPTSTAWPPAWGRSAGRGGASP